MAVRVFLLLAAALLAVTCFHATASDPSLLQDFCVVDKMSKGKDPMNYYILFTYKFSDYII
jgi:hypothetical protein